MPETIQALERKESLVLNMVLGNLRSGTAPAVGRETCALPLTDQPSRAPAAWRSSSSN